MAGRSVLPFYLNFQTLNLSLPNNCTNTVCLQEHAGMPDVVWTKAETWAENEPRSNLVFSTQSVLMGKRAGGFYLPLLSLHCLMFTNYSCEGEIFDSKLRVSG